MVKLRSLLNITEQAPQPPPADPMAVGAPVPAPIPPPTGQQPVDQHPPVPQPPADDNPSPDNPSEYDWTKDFRTFEDTKNRAEAEAKKKLLDQMNEKLIGKKVTVNASRGYGQPKTDRTVDDVKKISVEFWYKEWVVKITDENDKEFFLTPGVNIKIEGEQGETPGAEGGEEAPQEEPQSQEEPNAQQPPETNTGNNTQGGATVPGSEEAPQEPTVNVPGQQTQTGTTPQEPQPEEQPPVKKKKKLAMAEKKAEGVNQDLKTFLPEFMSRKAHSSFLPYMKKMKYLLTENKRATVVKTYLEIPVDHMVQPLDIREVKLSAHSSLWSSGQRDQRFCRGSINIEPLGRVYLVEFVKETEWLEPISESKELSHEELLETFQEDNASGEYISINEKDDAYYHGKLIVPAKKEQQQSGIKWKSTSNTSGPDWKGIQSWSKQNGVYLNVWRGNDHGNVSLYTITGKYLGGLV